MHGLEHRREQSGSAACARSSAASISFCSSPWRESSTASIPGPSIRVADANAQAPEVRAELRDHVAHPLWPP